VPASEDDYYKVLRVEEDASEREIKQAYHQLARELHSDVNREADEERLKDVNKAYDTLGTPALRAAYDKTRKTDHEARERADRASEARKRRERSAADTRAFGERIRNQGRPSSQARPRPSRPASTSPPPVWQSPPPSSITTEQPSPPRTPRGAKRLLAVGVLVAAFGFSAAPFGVMYFVSPALNAHPTLLLDAVSLGCAAWLAAGLWAIGSAFGNLFSEW
jgi:hypothetical protein